MRTQASSLAILALISGTFGSSQNRYPAAATDRQAWQALAFISRETNTAGAANFDTKVSWRLWWNSQDVYPQHPQAAAAVPAATASKFRPFACGPQSERTLIYKVAQPPNGPCEAIWLSSASVAYILQHGLWQREVVSSQAGLGQIHFPIDQSDPSNVPIELKTEWIAINRAQAAKYIVGVDDQGVPRGLAAFHMMIHTRPNWVWATFIHEDFAQSVIAAGETFQDAFGNTTGRPSQGLLQLLASYHVGVLAHYKLIGTQIDFDTPQLLGNPLIENPDAIKARKISCISCHSFAAIDSVGHNPTAVLTLGHPAVPPIFGSVNFNYTMAVHAVCTTPRCSTGLSMQSK
jgi:hypothetical protein